MESINQERFFSLLFHRQDIFNGIRASRLPVVALSPSPLCVTRKKTARKKQLQENPRGTLLAPGFRLIYMSKRTAIMQKTTVAIVLSSQLIQTQYLRPSNPKAVLVKKCSVQTSSDFNKERHSQRKHFLLRATLDFQIDVNYFKTEQ